MPQFTYRLRVAFVDTDASGRIHFTAMLRYFETAELEFLRSLGFSYRDAPHTGYPRVRVECEYRSAIGFDDELDIAVKVKHIGSSSYTLDFAALKNGAVAANGIIVAVCVNREKQRPQAMPEALREALKRSAQESASA